MKETLNSNQEFMFFGPIGRELYPPYAATQIASTFKEPNSRKMDQRNRMWRNYESFINSISTASLDLDIVGLVYKTIQEISLAAKVEMMPGAETELGYHLKEITEFSINFFLDKSGRSRFIQLSDHEATLLAYAVAPIHDVAKYLGERDSQIKADHEIMMKQVISRTFIGKNLKTPQGVITLNNEDVNFISEVVGDHENIYKEDGRTDFIKSKSAVTRAKGLFFIADVLTGAINIDSQTNEFEIVEDKFQKRFFDLCLRHANGEKEFRPQWIIRTITDLITTLSVINPNSNEISRRLVNSGTTSIETTKETKQGIFSPDQNKKLEEVLMQLQQI